MDSKTRCLHLANNSIQFRNKFVPDYASMITRHSKNVEHDFIYIGDDTGLEDNHSYKVFSNSFFDVIRFALILRLYDKVVFHTLPNKFYTLLLPCFFFLFRTEKFYITLWGGEIYYEDNLSPKAMVMQYFSKIFLRRMDGFITHIEKDYELAKSISKNEKAKLFNLGSFYPSNIVIGAEGLLDKSSTKLNVMIGASALKRNAHEIIIDRLALLNGCGNVKYYIPLSYGDLEYAKYISLYAIDKLGGSNVEILAEFMEPSEYFKFLTKIDIAIFGHDGQQAMGNILNLLSVGSNVYLNVNSTTYESLNRFGFKVFNFEDIKLDKEVLDGNVQLADKMFSLDVTIRKQNAFYTHKL